MDRRQALKTLQELDKRLAAAEKVDFGSLSFGPQRAFIEDDSRLSAAICGRRAGKTEAMALKAIRTATLVPDSLVLYITLSRPSAKRIIWPLLLKWDRRLELGAKFNHAELTMTLKNRSRIMLGGANDEAEIERYRGIATPLVILDEAQAFRSFLPVLVNEILGPATLDYRGQICLIGTPNASCTGYFHDATVGKIKDPETGEPIFNTHHWTSYDNPFLDPDYRGGKHDNEPLALERAETVIEDLRRRMGWKVDEPRYQREWLGRWVKDEEGLVFRIRPYNLIPSLPDGDWRFVLGMDIGYVDATAFVIMAYDERKAQAVVVGSFQRSQMIPSAICAEVDRLNDQWDFERIVVDPGGGGKLIIEEMRQRWGITAEVAQKRGKHAYIELLNGDLSANAVQVIEGNNEDLIHDCNILQWDYTRAKRGNLHDGEKLRIDDRTPDHLTDAFLYAFRECKQFLYDPEEAAPKAGTPEWFQAQEDELWEQSLKKALGEDSEEPFWLHRPY